MEVEFAGRLVWFGRQGRLEMVYDDAKNRWYAHIPVEVWIEATKTGKQSEYIVKGERRAVQTATPKGNKVASIDLGINVLASVVVDDGTWLLYKGVRVKEDYFYFEQKIAGVQSLADQVKKLGEYDAYGELARERRRLFEKLRRRFLHVYRALASELVERLHSLGVSTIYLGYPYRIGQDTGNKFSVNVWSYRELMDALELKAQEYGIKVYEVVEYGTSRVCAYHHIEVRRDPGGVVACPFGHRVHSDLNGALNIRKKATGVFVSCVGKPLSYIVDHNGVAPVRKGV